MATANMRKYLAKFDRVVSELCERTENKDRQTNKRTYSS